MVKNKKAMSQIVTTLIIILLTIVAIGIIWGVLKNTILKSTAQISLDNLNIDLKIKKVVINDTGVKVVVHRNTGGGEITGLKFIVSNGDDSQSFEKQGVIETLATKSYFLNGYNLGIVKTVEVAPIFTTESGKQRTGDIADSKKFTSKEAVKNIPGLVSWWRFEGNAQDEVGGNDGTASEGVSFVDGKYGKSASFNASKGINVGSLGVPLLTNETTICFWIYSNDVSFPNRQNPFNQAYGGWGTMTLESSGSISWYFGSNGGDASRYGLYGSSAGMITNKEWIHVCAVRNPSGYTYKWYKNGESFSEGTYDSEYPVINTRSFTLGDGYTNPINGLMDEPMIFNRALSATEIKGLYDLKL